MMLDRPQSAGSGGAMQTLPSSTSLSPPPHAATSTGRRSQPSSSLALAAPPLFYSESPSFSSSSSSSPSGSASNLYLPPSYQPGSSSTHSSFSRSSTSSTPPLDGIGAGGGVRPALTATPKQQRRPSDRAVWWSDEDIEARNDRLNAEKRFSNTSGVSSASSAGTLVPGEHPSFLGVAAGAAHPDERYGWFASGGGRGSPLASPSPRVLGSPTIGPSRDHSPHGGSSSPPSKPAIKVKLPARFLTQLNLQPHPPPTPPSTGSSPASASLPWPSQVSAPIPSSEAPAAAALAAPQSQKYPSFPAARTHRSSPPPPAIPIPNATSKQDLALSKKRSSSSVMKPAAPPTPREHDEGDFESLEVQVNDRALRKIMDLEIANESLLAVNSTLETTIREQAAAMDLLKRQMAVLQRRLTIAQGGKVSPLDEDDLPSSKSPTPAKPNGKPQTRANQMVSLPEQSERLDSQPGEPPVDTRDVDMKYNRVCAMLNMLIQEGTRAVETNPPTPRRTQTLDRVEPSEPSTAKPSRRAQPTSAVTDNTLTRTNSTQGSAQSSVTGAGGNASAAANRKGSDKSSSSATASGTAPNRRKAPAATAAMSLRSGRSSPLSLPRSPTPPTGPGTSSSSLATSSSSSSSSMPSRSRLGAGGSTANGRISPAGAVALSRTGSNSSALSAASSSSTATTTSSHRSKAN
ncbi:hypothetical protein DFJ73DRAFT_967225, partial [Zopfochytrium polystomum]